MMEMPQTPTQSRRLWDSINVRLHPLDSYGLVLILIILDYLVLSTLPRNGWGSGIVVAFLGATLVFALRTSEARPVWILLALVYFVASTTATLLSQLISGGQGLAQPIALIGGLLLLVTPFTIARRISTHKVVTTETVLGAVCIYLLVGFSFAFIYATIGNVSGNPFFGEQSQSTFNNYLFFSYSTLTTVGYGNLVPASSAGQAFAMLEALAGQIYLVIIVARLVSLWGQERPPVPARPASDRRIGSGSRSDTEQQIPDDKGTADRANQ